MISSPCQSVPWKCHFTDAFNTSYLSGALAELIASVVKLIRYKLAINYDMLSALM